MATVDEIDPPVKPSGGNEANEGDKGPKDFKFYCKAENAYTILEKRWGIFSIGGFFAYSFHFVMCIWGVDSFCHYSRFLSGCKDMESKYVDNTASLDGIILAVTVFHMIEWIRQAIFLTSVLVGINWINIYYVLCVNIPFGLLTTLIGFIMGVTSEECLSTAQPGRAFYLTIQILSFFLYMTWCMLPIAMFKVNNKMFPPQAEKEGEEPEYSSWCQQQYEMEDEEDED